MTTQRGVKAVEGGLLPFVLLSLTLLSIFVAAVIGPADRGNVLLSREATEHVVVVGIDDWGWADLDDMPATRQMAQTNVAGNLIVRGTNLHTCASDGWLTLGAGQRAASINTASVTPCAIPVNPQASWSAWQDYADDQSLVAELGTLGQTVIAGSDCVQATGPLAALGAADRSGDVANARDGNLADWPGIGDCRLDLIDTVGMSPAQIDTSLASARESLPDNTLLIVAGLSDRGDLAQPAVHPVVMAHTSSMSPPTLITSTSTRQPGLAQTTDLSATILTSLGYDIPQEVAGLPVRYLPDTDGLPDSGGRDNDLDALASTATAATLVSLTQAPYVLGLVAIFGLGLVVALISRKSRWRAVAGSAVMAAPAAAYASSLLPWWAPTQGSWPMTNMGLSAALAVIVTVLLDLVVVAIAWAGPWRRDARGPMAIIAAITLTLLSVDVVLGGPLGLISPLGVNPITAGRFYGVGNVAFGILSAAALILAACVASWWRSRPRLAAGSVILIGLLATAIDGVPAWGADFGGVPAMVVSTGVLALFAAGQRLTWARAGLIALVALGVAGSLMIIDFLRPAGSRTHLGEFVQAVIDGEAWQIVTRKLDQSVGILIAYPASWIAVVVLLLVAWVVARPTSKVWQTPMMRAGAMALLACWFLGWVLNDSGIAVAALGLTVAIGAGLVLSATGFSERAAQTTRRDIA